MNLVKTIFKYCYKRFTIINLILLVFFFYVGISYVQITYRLISNNLQNDLVESFVTQQIQTFPDYKKLYMKFENQPSLLTAYPPFFFTINKLIWGESFNFTKGRTISLISLWISFAIIYHLSKKELKSFILLFTLFFSSKYLIIWGTMNRVDMLAICLSLISIFLFEKFKKNGYIWAALFMSLTLFTKQSIGIPTFFYLTMKLLYNKKIKQLTIFLILFFLGVVLPFLTINLITDGGYYFNLIIANTNMEFIKKEIIYWFLELFFTNIFIITFIFLFITRNNNFAKQIKKDWQVYLYFIISIIVGISVGKSGSNSNYLLELTIGLFWLFIKIYTSLKTLLWKKIAISFLIFHLLLVFIIRNQGIINFGDKYQYIYTFGKSNYNQPNELFEEIKDHNNILADGNAVAYLSIMKKKIVLDPFAINQLIGANIISQDILSNYISSQHADLILLNEEKKNICCTKSSTSSDILNANNYMWWTKKTYDDISQYYEYKNTINNYMIFIPKKL